MAQLEEQATLDLGVLNPRPMLGAEIIKKNNLKQNQTTLIFLDSLLFFLFLLYSM